ncbi:MAG: cysteine hydrolase [Actinobacteria bacterium]|nr:cysteine hydrolase [Actinomycetota bacterium]
MCPQINDSKKSSKALFIVDMLNDFVRDGAPLKVAGIEKIIEPIKIEIKKARKLKYPVIYICDSHDKNDIEFKLYPPHAIKGTHGADIIDELRPQSKDTIIHKKTLSSFYKTGLEKIMREKKIAEIILTGCIANICIQYTAFETVIRGFQVNILLNGIIALSKVDYDTALDQMQKVLKVKLI